MGCGFGARAVSLARHGCAIIALADARATATFTAARLAAASPSGPRALHRVLLIDGLARLPVPDRSIDIALLPLDLACDRGGWFAPCSIEAMMAEVDRVLTPDGLGLLTGANRWAAHRIASHWRRWSYGRSRSPQTNAPRRADLVHGSRLQEKRLLGFGGYQRSLRRAGLQGAASWILVRDAAGDLVGLRDAMTPVHAPGARVSLKMRIKGSVVFAPEFVILGTRTVRPEPSLVERAIEAVNASLRTADRGASVRVAGYYVSRKDKLVADLRTPGDSLIMRLCLSPAARTAEERAASTLRRLGDAKEASSWFPRPLLAAEIEGLFFSAEQKLDGRSLLACRSSMDESQLLAAARSVLLRTNRDPGALPRKSFDGDLWQALVTQRIRRLAEVSDLRDQLARLEQWLERALRGRIVAVGLVHGDVSMNNVFLRANGDCALIDWENSTSEDLPVLDSLAFLRSVHTHRYRDDDGAGRARLAFGKLTVEEDRFLAGEFERFDAPRECHAALVYLQWIHAITCNLDFAFMQSAANIERHIDGVLRAIPDEALRN